MVFPRFGGKNDAVLSMGMPVILDSLFARPGSAPIWGAKKGEFRDWTKVFIKDIIYSFISRFVLGIVLPVTFSDLIDSNYENEKEMQKWKRNKIFNLANISIKDIEPQQFHIIIHSTSKALSKRSRK